ncbi:DNA cytosine methyltransferase [Burkholderia gladioli]|uniref:DNA cytosine methyltransferase n=1 Tax=Burkholderia gladioli TaxID=28095 RepID=UPI001641103B|nr:DNA cytosine methyltransferase [Burkholderia gladioli]
MSAYYNEIDPYAAQWLRNLIAAGHIAPGDVDERSIEDVRPDDLRGYTQCHFFAGIGVWSYALRRAGWPDERPVWTGSCPCQPFSAAGKGLGFADERHLWPSWHWLIGECRPAIVFGEQVASSAVEPWIDLVQADVESLGHAFGCVPFPSAGVNAPHIRDRAYWFAYATSKRHAQRDGFPSAQSGWSGSGAETVRHGGPVGLADADGSARQEGRSDVRGRRDRGDAQPRAGSGDGGGLLGGLGNAERTGLALSKRIGGVPGGASRADPRQTAERAGLHAAPGAGSTDSFWRAADWILCRDGRWRPVEPGTFPLVDGAPSRVGRLRAHGNAINAEAARAFIETCIELI